MDFSVAHAVIQALSSAKYQRFSWMGTGDKKDETDAGLGLRHRRDAGRRSPLWRVPRRGLAHQRQIEQRDQQHQHRAQTGCR